MQCGKFQPANYLRLELEIFLIVNEIKLRYFILHHNVNKTVKLAKSMIPLFTLTQVIDNLIVLLMEFQSSFTMRRSSYFFFFF